MAQPSLIRTCRDDSCDLFQSYIYGGDQDFGQHVEGRITNLFGTSLPPSEVDLQPSPYSDSDDLPSDKLTLMYPFKYDICEWQQVF